MKPEARVTESHSSAPQSRRLRGQACIALRLLFRGERHNKPRATDLYQLQTFSIMPRDHKIRSRDDSRPYDQRRRPRRSSELFARQQMARAELQRRNPLNAIDLQFVPGLRADCRAHSPKQHLRMLFAINFFDRVAVSKMGWLVVCAAIHGETPAMELSAGLTHY